MDLQTVTTKNICPRGEIAVYLDGELAPREELLLEQHLAVCQKCLAELNSQKKLLMALDFAFDEKSEEIELPKNFTKIVVANAENRVMGLRSKKERLFALWLCAGLFPITLLALGSETQKIFLGLANLGSQILAVVGFAGRFIFDIAIGFAVVLRSLSQSVVFSSGFIALSLFCLLAFVLFAYTKFNFKPNR